MKAPEKVEKLFSLPVGGAGCGDIAFHSDGTEFVVEYEFKLDGQDTVGGLKFSGVQCFRYVEEMHCVGFIVESYDHLVVVDSTWQHAHASTEPDGIVFPVDSARHFALMLSNNGYLELLAESCEETPTREGFLS